MKKCSSFDELLQSPEVPKGTFRDCKQSPRSRASPDFGSLPIQKVEMSQDCDISAPKTPKILCFRDISVRFGCYDRGNKKKGRCSYEYLRND